MAEPQQSALTKQFSSLAKAVSAFRKTVDELRRVLAVQHPESFPSILGSCEVLLARADALLAAQVVGNTALRSSIFVPMQLSTEPDQDLAVKTDGRISAFQHTVVPDLLRTKLLPEMEHANSEIAASIAGINRSPEEIRLSIEVFSRKLTKVSRIFRGSRLARQRQATAAEHSFWFKPVKRSRLQSEDNAASISQMSRIID